MNEEKAGEDGLAKGPEGGETGGYSERGRGRMEEEKERDIPVRRGRSRRRCCREELRRRAETKGERGISALGPQLAGGEKGL